MSTPDRIIAIVVTYHPDLGGLARLLDALKCQVARTVIVDNGPGVEVNGFLTNRNDAEIHCLPLGDNLGVATAQNAGIAWAQEQGADFVVLMDQDSVPQSEMVKELLKTYSRLTKQNIKVAAIGCRYKDGDESQLSGFVRFTGRIGARVENCDKNQQEVKCDFVIASGTLIPMRVIENIGVMDDGLFIDHVDTEWCLRARAKGYKIYGSCSAVMRHELGSNRIRIWFIRPRMVSVHAPFRYYYMVRNSILLHRRDYPDKAWRMFDIQRLFQILLFFGLFVPGRVSRLHMIFKGFRDGMRGVTGKLTD